MNRLRVATIILILSAGITVSYIILKSAVPETNQSENTVSNSDYANLISQNPIEWLAKAVEKSGFIDSANKLDNFADSKGINSETSSLKSVDFGNINLTEFVAKSLFTQMKNLDQSGKNPFETFDFSTLEGKEFLEKAIAGIDDPSLFFSSIKIDDKDLKISQDNSLKSFLKYFESITSVVSELYYDIYKNPLKVLGKFMNSDDMNVSGIIQLANAYSNVLNKYYSITVPSDFIDLHKRYLMILKKMEVACRGIANFQEDPVKAGLFIKLIPEFIMEELSVKKEYSQKMTNFGFVQL